MDQCSRHYLVYGRVQGVFFRGATQQEAVRLSINGWVRNLNDGSVEVYATGDRMAIVQFEQWLATGPRHAVVTKVEASDARVQQLLEFSVR